MISIRFLADFRGFLERIRLVMRGRLGVDAGGIVKTQGHRQACRVMRLERADFQTSPS
jgi:hypothetical protein